jgi:hypothetical protein
MEELALGALADASVSLADTLVVPPARAPSPDLEVRAWLDALEHRSSTSDADH